MPGEPLSIFLSYSRTDSELVDRLEADLKARNYYVWVDRRKIEGGQDWEAELQKAIDRCQLMLVVLSPEAMASKYVRREYRYADGEGKPIIPINWRTTKVDLVLNDIQWVNFQSSYDQGFSDLQIVLSRLELAALPQTQSHPSTSFSTTEPDPVLVTPQPAPAPPAADLNELYRAGVAARAEGNLERTAIFWQQVLDRESSFGNGALAPQMQRLQAELHPLRVQRLRDQAEQAHRSGAWGQEIGAWQALLGLEPKDKQAQQRIPVAQQNQKFAWVYENAQEFAKTKNIPALKEQLGLLWHDAPYYGDPADLARLAGLKVPPSFQEATNIQSKAQAAEAAAQRKAEQTTERKAQRKEFRTEGSGALDTYSAVIWSSAFCLLAGTGATAGMLSQSWPLAIGVALILALLSYFLGYHRAVGSIETSIIFLIGVVLIFAITWFLSTFPYDQPQTSHLWFNAVRILTVRHQIIFGIILGGLGGIIGGRQLTVGLNNRRYDKEYLPFVILVVLGITVATWLIVATVGSIFNWGFGFGYGWGITAIAGIPCAFIGMMGLIASGNVCWKALTNSPEEVHGRVVELASEDAGAEG